MIHGLDQKLHEEHHSFLLNLEMALFCAYYEYEHVNSYVIPDLSLVIAFHLIQGVFLLYDFWEA